MPQRLLTIINWTENHFWNILCALLAGLLNYFIEIKEVIYVLLFAFMLDLVLGISASIFIEKSRFQMKKFFIAVLRLLISALIIMLFFVMGKVMHIAEELHNIISWIISGAFGYSAIVNGYKLTGGRFFLLLRDLIKKKVKDNTGISIDKLNGEMYDKD